MYDFIGDIHGYAEKLVALLEKMGYSLQNGTYAHPTRKVLFIGDYIDRGSQIRETLQIVRNMVESNQAIALMGNHEYNAICFNTKNENGNFLREHSLKNAKQHIHTLRQFQYKKTEYNNYIEWFKTLPLFYETEDFRAVHACWDQKNIASLRSVLENDQLNDSQLVQATNAGTRLFNTIEETLKGKELQMPNELSFNDKDGHFRHELRIKWWENPLESSYQSISIIPLEALPNTALPSSLLNKSDYYYPTEKPVFFGHYWLEGTSELHRNNICCLDYSVANEGNLVAYRFYGEKELSNEHFVHV